MRQRICAVVCRDWSIQRRAEKKGTHRFVWKGILLKLVFSTKKSGVNIEKEIKSSITCMWLCPKALSQITITTDFHLRMLPNDCHCPQFKLIGPLTLASYGECNFISFLIYSKAHRCFGKELKMISGIRIGSSRAYLSRSRTINNRTNKPK